MVFKHFQFWEKPQFALATAHSLLHYPINQQFFKIHSENISLRSEIFIFG